MNACDFDTPTHDPPPLAHYAEPLAYHRANGNSWPAVLRAIGITGVSFGLLSTLELFWDFRYLVGGSNLLRLLAALSYLAGGIAGALLLIAGLFVLNRRLRKRAFFAAACWTMIAAGFAESFACGAWSYSQGPSWSATSTVAQAFVYPMESSLLPALMLFLISRPSIRILFAGQGAADDQPPAHG